RGWINAMDRPGAFQVGYLRRLIQSRPMLGRVPDSSLIVGGLGDKGEHIEAFRGGDNSYAMVYLPIGKIITINTSVLPKRLAAWWFNPKDGTAQKATVTSDQNTITATPPTTGIENDWVLVLDDVTKGYGVPGK